MANTEPTLLQRVKTDLRISHNQLDTDIQDMIDACLADLEICGIEDPEQTDKTIIAIVKLYCRANYTDDTAKAEAYMNRYADMKRCLMMATGYGRPDDE